MEVHDQTYALSSILVDVFKDLDRWPCAPEIWVGEKERVVAFGFPTQFPIQKEKILPSTLAKNVDELWASAVPKNHPATTIKAAARMATSVWSAYYTNTYVPSGVFYVPRKKEHVCGLILFQILSYSYRYYRYYYDHVLQVPTCVCLGFPYHAGADQPHDKDLFIGPSGRDRHIEKK